MREGGGDREGGPEVGQEGQQDQDGRAAAERGVENLPQDHLERDKERRQHNQNAAQPGQPQAKPAGAIENSINSLFSKKTMAPQFSGGPKKRQVKIFIRKSIWFFIFREVNKYSITGH